MRRSPGARFLLTGALCAGLFAAPAMPQDGQGSFVAAAAARPSTGAQGGLFVVQPFAATVMSLGATGALLHSYSIAADPYDDILFFVGTKASSTTAAPEIHRVEAAGGKILRSSRLAVPLTASDAIVWQVYVFGPQLIFLTSTQLAVVAKTGGTPRVLRQWTAADSATNFACDGRSVFLHMQPDANVLADHIVRVDLEGVNADVEIYRSQSITNFITSVSLDGLGNVLLAEYEAFSAASELKLIDPTGKLLRGFTLPFLAGSSGARIDPSGAVVVASGTRYDAVQKRYLTGFVTILNWALFKTEFGTSPEPCARIELRNRTSLHRNGHLCTANGNWRIEIGAVGLPTSGNAQYRLLATARPSRPALLLVGLNGQLPAPLGLAGLGAGTCVLGALPIVSIGLAFDSSGNVTLPFPIPTMPATNIDTQWAVLDASANAAGLVTSQVGSVNVR